MKYLDTTRAAPAENLALDEALLDLCEAAGGPSVLRFWEPSVRFVVLGYANRVRSEVHVDACAEAGVSIQRRISGGGTVLQGPGCLNYTLVLLMDESSELQTIAGTNRFVLERHARAIGGLVGRTVDLRGQTDLALDRVKISGNSQRRKRQALLFHGTLLLDLSLADVERFLAMPSHEPDYRRARSHHAFMRNLSVPADEVKRALRREWGADEPLPDVPIADAVRLVESKYARESWVWRM